MPLSKVALFRSAVLAIVIGVTALLTIVGVTLWLVERARTSADDVYTARQQRSALVDLRGLLQEAETGQRGYLLGGEESYLAPYEDARKKVPAQLDKVRQLLAGEGARVQRLATIVESKMLELADTVRLTRDGQRQEAVAIVRTDRGRELMEEARNLFATLVGEAETRVSERLENQLANITFLRWVTLIGAIVIIAVSASILTLVAVYTRQLQQAQRDVQVLNADLEDRVKERTQDLARANEEVQRFAYIVTHDLRAPLVNIMGFTSELETSIESIRAFIEREDGAVPQEVSAAALQDLPEAIGFIRSSTRKMDGLINAILKLSREGRRTLKPERLDLDAVLRAAADNFQHQVAEAGGEVAIECRLPPITTDRLALEQIFGNLLDNAVKYRAPDRPLSIRIRSKPGLGNRIVVAFEDNGRGIAPQDHERVFDLFRRSGAQDQPGEGIGLAHVRAMARNLGGEVTVASELGQGTIFEVSLPRDLRKAMGVA